MIPSTTVIAHALHDSAALGIHPAAIALAAAGVLTVAVVLPSRLDAPQVALPEPAQHAPAVAAAAPSGWPRRALAGTAALVACAAVVVGLAGPAVTNLAALLVANVVLPAAVVVGLLGGGPRPTPEGVSRPDVLTVVLLVPLALTHPLGSAGGVVAGAVVGGYLAVTVTGRIRRGVPWWRHHDPLGVLVGAVGRLSPLARDATGARRRWLAALWDPLTPAERLVVGVLLAAAIARAARFVPVWQQLVGGRPLTVRTLAAALLVAYVLAMLALLDRAWQRRDGDGVSAAVVALLVALLLANDLAPALFSIALAGTLLSDPLGTGADLFGTAERTVGTGLLSSPLVWLWQLVVVLVGGALATTVQRDLDRAAGRHTLTRAVSVAVIAGGTVALLVVG